MCVLDIEIEGVKQIKNTNLNPLLVFIEPPSIEELEQRLRKRNTETEDSLQKRLNTARTELEYGGFQNNVKIPQEITNCILFICFHRKCSGKL